MLRTSTVSKSFGLKNLVVASVAAIALTVGQALAADLGTPYYKAAPPPPAPSYPWGGCHLGVNLGGGWTSESATTSLPATGPTGASNTLVTVPFDGSLDWPTGLSGSNNAGVTGGGQAGCDYQTGTFVFGIETDFEGYGAKAGSTA
jgi:outer membrane immunogenic protein